MTRLSPTTIAAGAPAAIVAVIAGVVSYGHIETLALVQHQPLASARLLPFAIDALIVAGSVILLAGSRLGWLGVVPGVAATVFANVESGIRYGWLSATVAVLPAMSFTVACFMLERWLKAQASRPSQGGSQVAPQERESAEMRTPDEPEPATPEPAEPPPAHCGHDVAGNPEEMVVRAYLHSRDCLGETLSQRQLASQYGVSRPRVKTLVGSLNGNGPQPGSEGGEGAR